MKRVWLRAVLAAACLIAAAGCAAAQDVMRVYVNRDVFEEDEAWALTQLLREEFPQTEFELIGREEGNLRELVLSDCAPEIAVSPPREARIWAKEGLLLPLQDRIDDQTEIAREILSVCVHEENLFMAPLIARHRQMAINVKLFEKRGLGYMLDEVAHPVWYPTEFQQMLEEFAIADMPAMEIWEAQQQDCAAMEALIQSIYCGSLLEEDGWTCSADDPAICAGVRWLRDLAASEMIVLRQTKDEALDRFLAGETAIFIDWNTKLEKRYAERIKENGMTIETRAYPSASGLPVRSYEVAGVSVFDSQDESKNALALQAAAFLHEDDAAQRMLGSRGIFDDDSIWLWDLSASDRGATLRSMLCDAMKEILEKKRDIAQALEMVEAGMDTAK